MEFPHSDPVPSEGRERDLSLVASKKESEGSTRSRRNLSKQSTGAMIKKVTEESTNATEETVRSLPTDVDESLLRGVTLSVALSGWCKHWAASAASTSMYDVTKTFDLSFQVSKYFGFLSHDWKTSRWSKLVTMLILFNLRAAAVGTVLFVVLYGHFGPWRMNVEVMQEETLPFMLLHATPYLVALFFLCMWQRIRSVTGRPLVVFLDKLCIQQHDSDLKAKGIRSLASFLDRSEQLFILWSPRYFSRLWCAYELATFLRNPAQSKPVTLVPVSMSKLLAVMAVSYAGMLTSHKMAMITAPPGEASEHDHAITLHGSLPVLITGVVLCFTCSVAFFYTGLGMMADLSALDHQLRKFSIRDSECFCCTHGHRHPSTGEPLMCDRTLVFDAVKQWYGRGSDVAEEHLDRFDRAVQTNLRQRVLKGVDSAILPFRTFVYLACVLASPALFAMSALPFDAPESDHGHQHEAEPVHKPDMITVWFLLTEYSHTWLRYIVEALLVIGMMIRTCMCGSRLLKWMSRVKASLLLAPIGFVGTVLTIHVVPHSFHLVASWSWDLIPLVLIFWFLLALCLFSGAGCCPK